MSDQGCGPAASGSLLRPLFLSSSPSLSLLVGSARTGGGWGEQFLAGRIKSILLFTVLVPHHMQLRGQCPQHAQPGVLSSISGVQGSLLAFHELG